MRKIILFLPLFALLTVGCGGGSSSMPWEDDLGGGDNTTPEQGTTGVEVGQVLPAWSEGEIDIHFINTARGECCFYILPDGTRLLVDAGDLGDASRWTHKEIMPAVPSAEKRPAEWIARYIEHFSKPIGKELYLDYAMITHFDTDHYGRLDHLAIEVEGKPYKYTGMTHLPSEK